jgi:hypothetical protein
MAYAGLIVAVIALVISLLSALFARSTQGRADFRERLTWLQTARNALHDLPDSPSEDVEAEYEKQRVWMRTCLKVSETFGARLDRLPRTIRLAEAPFDDRPTELADALRDARLELDEALGDKAGDKPRLIRR